MFNILIFLRFHRLLRSYARKRITILGYHGFVGEEELTSEQNLQGMQLCRAKFAEQLRYVKANYNVVSLEQVVKHYEGGDMPDYPLVITIDDGYRGTYTQAIPALEEAGIPASVFVATGFLDGKEMLWHDRVENIFLKTDLRFIHLEIEGTIYSFDLEVKGSRGKSLARLLRVLKTVPNDTRLRVINELEWLTDVRWAPGNDEAEHQRALDWEQVQNMRDNGQILLGAHTVSHPIITKCSPRKMREELILSKTRLEEQLAYPCDHFCYPNGTRADFSSETRALLAELGFRSGLTTVPGLNGDQADLLELKRFTIDSRLDLAGFIATITGLNNCLAIVKSTVLGFFRNPLSFRQGIRANG